MKVKTVVQEHSHKSKWERFNLEEIKKHLREVLESVKKSHN